MLKKNLPPDIGRRLGELRSKAKMSQSAVAPKVRVDQSRISRIESAEVAPSLTEVRTFLEALGTDEAREYLAYLEKDWQLLPRPAPENPDLEAIWLAEQNLQRLDAFERERTLPGPARAEVDMHRQSLRHAAEFLTNLDHQIAFIGDIGVGKTTALCLAADLCLPDPSATLDNKIVLETGGGRITICEVHIKAGPAWGIIIEPTPEAEIYGLVADLCEGLMAKDLGADETAEKGLPRELDRALRNMANLAKTLQRTPDGKRVVRDPARELAETVGTLDELRSEFSSRLQLWKRATRELWYRENSKLTPPEWLRDTFTKINNGRLEAVSLPQRVDIVVPSPLLKQEIFNVGFVDTRGVDGTAIRPDLKARLDDPRTLTVLCSKFPSAPDTSMQGFIEHAIETGSERAVSERVALLVLPRPGEALVMKDDVGERVDTDTDGYELKRDQILAGLKRLAMEDLPVLFFNAISDRPTELAEQLVQLVSRMRRAQVERIDSLAQTVDSLIANYELEAAAAVRRAVANRLRIFIEQNEFLLDPLHPAHDLLVGALQSAHPRTVWATTRRSGSWYNLDVYYYLGAGAAAEAKRRSDPAFHGLEALVTNMLGDNELSTAHGFLQEVRVNAKGWAERFLEAARLAGQETFRPGLKDDSALWSKCEARWGLGPGYRHDVSIMVREWFSDPTRGHLHRALEARVRAAWKNEVLEPLRLLCGDAT